jgi:hypothetical protein
MQALSLPGLHGAALQLDHCRACRLVWFDALEPSALAQSAWVALLQEMARSGDATAASLDTAPTRCPRCQSALEATLQVMARPRATARCWRRAACSGRCSWPSACCSRRIAAGCSACPAARP